MLPTEDAALLALAGIDDLPPPEEGLFRADCWLRTVSHEPVMLFGGGRALLLEVAHPLVAAGVARHSNFRTDPFGRLRRTLDAVSQLVFGNREVALAAARRVEAVHHAVRGTLRDAQGPWASDAAYDGRAPDLAGWVWATLADTSLVVYEHFVAKLEPSQREAYYRDHRAVGRLLGVPADRVPPDYAAFRGYVEGRIASPELCVGDEGREIAHSVLHPPGGLQGGGTLRLVTTALLPPRLREAFGLPWDAERAGRFEQLAGNVRRLRAEAGRR